MHIIAARQTSLARYDVLPLTAAAALLHVVRGKISLTLVNSPHLPLQSACTIFCLAQSDAELLCLYVANYRKRDTIFCLRCQCQPCSTQCEAKHRSYTNIDIINYLLNTATIFGIIMTRHMLIMT